MPEFFRKGAAVGFSADVAKVWGYGEQGLIGYLAVREKGDYLSPEDILEMSSISAARAVGQADRIGSLEVGKKADIVIRRQITESQPALDVIRNLAFVDRTKSVDTVIVDGRPVIERGRPTLVESEQVYERAGRSARTLCDRLGLKPGTPWPVIP